ncbi:MAG: efflux transporter outer membrane subunit [Bacteroidales bacterium]
MMRKQYNQRMSWLNAIWIALVALTLNACMMGPNFQKSEVVIPEVFRTEIYPVDSSHVPDYHDVFKEPALLALIDTALQNNPDALIAASRINEARAYLGMAKADRLPSFGYSGNTAFGNTLGSFPTGQGADVWFSATANVNWELDFWGKFRRATEAAQSELLASEYGLQAIELSLIAQIANTYYSLMDYKKRKVIAENTLTTRTKFLNIIRERYDKGIVPEIDLNQAQIQEAYAAAAVPVYSRSIAFTENALSVLIGKNPQEITTTGTIDELEVPENIPIALPSQVLTRRPDVLQAEQQLVAQNARIGVAQALRFPSISLTGLLGIASTDLSAFNAGDALMGSVGAGLLGPIFQFGKNKRRVEAESERTEQMRLNYEKVVLEAFRETEDALINIQTVEEEVSLVEKQLDASANAARLSRQRYDGGISSYLEVLDAERTLFEIELYYSELQYRQLSAYTNLYKTLGGSW